MATGTTKTIRIFDEKAMAKGPVGGSQIPSEFPGMRFKKNVDRVFKVFEGFQMYVVAISTVKRERVGREARKREKEDNFCGFRWPVTGKI